LAGRSAKTDSGFADRTLVERRPACGRRGQAGSWRLAEIIVTRVWGKGKENSGEAMRRSTASRLRQKM